MAIVGAAAVATGVVARVSSASSTAPSATGRQHPTLRDTNFPIPSGARFVAPNGRDGNSGSSSAPYGSIRKALSAVPSGGTVVLRGGTYHQSLGSLSKRVTIQAYPHEAPWLVGNRSSSAMSVGSRAAGSHIRGIGFQYWGKKSLTGDAIQISGSSVTLDSDTIADSGGRGIGVYGTNVAIVNSMIVNSGSSGMNAHKANGLDFEHNEVSYSNSAHRSIQPGPSAQIGGVKITKTLNTVFRGNDFHDNDSNGLWFDQTSANQVVISNRLIRNHGHGLAIEVSGHSIVAENLIADSGRDGLKLSGANDVAVYNNTIVGNGWAQIGIYEDPRHSSGPATSDTSNVSLGNNVFMSSSNAQKYVLYSFDLHHPAKITTLKMLHYDDHNVYGRTNTGKPKSLFYTQTSANGRTGYSSLTAFKSASHREGSSTSTDGMSLSRVFVDPGHYNYKLTSGAPVPHPTELPNSVAAALGSSTHVSHVGA